MSESTYIVNGMTCDHCVRAVTAELETLPGVSDVEVDLTAGRVRVVSDQPLSDAVVRTAVEEAGYEVAG